MSLYLQLLSIATPYSSPCIVLCTENNRFIVDVGEGIQRLCMEHKIKLGKINSILITKICQDTLGGLPGLFLTAADSGLNSLNFIGPNNLNKYWECMSTYVYRPKVNLMINDITQIIQTDDIIIKAIPINTNKTHICYLFTTPELLGKFDLKKALDLNIPKGPLFAKLKKGESITLECGKVILPQDVLGPSKPSTAILIVCNIDDINNHIDPILFQNLTENRYFDDYKIGGIFNNQIECMVHLSSRNTISNDNYINWIQQFSTITHICAGYHGISEETSYYSASLYCNKLSTLCPHSFDALPLGLQRNISDIFKSSDLSKLDSLVDDVNHSLMININKSAIGDKVLIKAIPLMKYNITLCKSCSYKIIIPDLVKFLHSEVTTFYNNYITNEEGLARLKHQENVYKYVHRVEGSHDSLESNISEHVSNLYDLKSNKVSFLSKYNDHELYFLGTGCAVPSKYRNVSGILLRLKTADVLFDVGEASWHQLIRMELQIFTKRNHNHFDLQDAYDSALHAIVKKLKVIWISHPHADHHLGLIKILEERKRVLELHNEYNNYDKIIVIAPSSVIAALNKYHRHISEYARYSYTIVNCQYFDPYDQLYTKSTGTKAVVEDIAEDNTAITCKTVGGKSSYLPQVSQALEVLESIGISDLVNVQVQHCSQAYGIAITLKPLHNDIEPIKIVYSGDTRPCDALVSIGMNATILIHEATFEDKKVDDAIKKNHSTMAEAISVGKQMNAFRVILTHFSQRYQKVPPVTSHDILRSESAETNSCNVILAFDFMHMTFLDILWLPSLSHILSLAFPIDCDDNEEYDDTNLYDDGTTEEEGSAKTKIIKL